MYSPGGLVPSAVLGSKQGPGVVSLDICWTPRALFKGLSLEKTSVSISWVPLVALNLVSDSAPFPYVRQN